MDRKEFLNWIRETYNIEPDYPWNDWNAVLRHTNNRKWFGLILEVAENKLGLQGDKIVDVLNVKCDPVLIGNLRQRKGFFPAYHMNKDRWISILLDDSVSADEIKDLVDLSFKLTLNEKVSEQKFLWTARLFSDGKLVDSKYFDTQAKRDQFVAENPEWKKRGKICAENLENHIKSK